MFKELPPLDTLCKLLRYEPDTGNLFWKHRPLEFFASKNKWSIWNNRWADKPAFTAIDDSGYHFGTFLKSGYKAHRMAYAIFYGVCPKGEIDHINGIRTDNRIVNLRDVSKYENGRNQRLRFDSKSGCAGVTLIVKSGKWRARIKHNGEMLNLGQYYDLEEAVAVRKAAEVKYGYHKNHGSVAASQGERY
jgi:hypothetical protein